MRLVIEEGKIEYSGEPLIEHLNFEVMDNAKIAIIGKNGCGKSSLLKVLEGELDLVFDSTNPNGYINKSNDFSIGYLKQISIVNENNTLEEEILECYKEIINKKLELERLEKLLEKDTSDKVIESYSKASEEFENMGGYFYHKEYNTVLKKFGFNKACFTKKLSEFSGGERTKIAFIKLLLSRPDLLLLDEPTNHLDIEAIEWLEDYLKGYKGAFIVVSHDREFINKVAKTIYEIEDKRITRYTGNYDDYLKIKENNLNSLKKQYETQQKEIKHQQELIDRFRYKATKAKMVQSRIKQLDKMELIEPPKSSNKKVFKMDINPKSVSGKEVLSIKELEIGYNKVLAKVNLDIYKGQKIAIIGENGSGKSTFLKTIMGIISPLSGEYKYGFNVVKGYFDQQVATKVNNKTILEDYRDTFPYLNNQEVRNDLGAFLFTGNEVNKRLNVLSGGEVVRFSLCKLLKTKPNFLILDEPTNHMDIYSKETIERMLKDYKGTILFVSHDRYFVRKIGEIVIAFEDNKANIYPYGYNQYLSKKENKKYELPQENKKKTKKEILGDDRVNLKKELVRLESEINAKEKQIKEISDEFEKEEVYSDFLLTRELEEKQEAIEDDLEILMREWEEVVKLLEEKGI